MAKSFVNQNLSDRSFRGEILIDANFTGADLRGCDFRNATLVGANFTSVTTGKSRRHIEILIAVNILLAPIFLIMPLISYGVIEATKIMFSLTIPSVLMIASAGVLLLGSRMSLFIGAIIGTGIGSCVSFCLLAYKAALQNNWLVAAGLSFVWIFLLSSYRTIYISITNCIKNDIGTQFQGANLTHAKFINAKLSATDFHKTNCNYVDWQGAKIDKNCIVPRPLRKEIIRNICTNLQAARNEDLTGESFENSYLVEVDLVDANLENANFCKADLRKAKLINANLESANLSGANLQDSKLIRANLQDSKLNSADLRNSELMNANLSNTQALGSNFVGANLTGACIENWWINPNTKFDDVICDYIFLNQNLNENGQIVYEPNSRKPAIGNFQQGDFTKLICQYLDSLDLIFRNGDDPKAFAFALQELLNNYPEAEIEFKSLDNLGDGDIVLRLIVGNQSIQKSTLHSFFTQASNLAKSFFAKPDSNDSNQLQSEIKQLKQKLEAKEQYIEILESRLTSRKQTLAQDDKVGNNFSLISITVTDIMFGRNKKTDVKAHGDVSGVAGDSISGVAGKDQKGIAGRDINGQVTVTIQQLRDSDTAEAPQLVELLTQLQTTIAESPDLSDKDKQKALKYLDNIGEIANKKDGDRNRIDELIDNILGVVSKAAKLLTPVQSIADSLRKLLQL